MEDEKPYTIREVAELTGLSPQTVAKMFEHEPGVIIFEEQRLRKRTGYPTIRIPRHVYRRVIEKWTVQRQSQVVSSVSSETQ